MLTLAVPLARTADTKKWTWIDGHGNTKDSADLKSLLKAHAHWLDTRPGDGHLDLSRANLSRADLAGANLREANLSGANLREANLGSAQANFAYLSLADFSGAEFAMADFSGANLEKANLSGANLFMADISRVNLSGTNLHNAHLSLARVRNVIFEPAQNPNPHDIAYAEGLDEITWNSDSGPVYAMRKSLSDAGFRKAARRLTAAIHRHDQSRTEKWLFDWTCEWGADYLRPLMLVGVLCLTCTAVYWAGMHFGSRGGLYLAATGQRIKTDKGKERVFRLSPRSAPLPREDSQLELAFNDQQSSRRPAPMMRRFRQFFRREVKAIGTAYLFSLMSVFNIGFREFNFGRWIRMLQPREFDIRARGWMRTVSGVQSLLGVALIALSLLSYFGHPFD